MDSEHFDQLALRLDAAQTRRFTVGSGLAALGLAMVSTEVQAKKKRKKKRKKKKPEPPTCAELCGVDCTRCFHRADAPPLCGDGLLSTCVPCTSDNDCIGLPGPYCVTHLEERADSVITNNCGSGGLCTTCDVGACTGMDVCVP